MKVSKVFSKVDVHLKDRRAQADNSGYHDARLFYTIDLASSRAHYGTPLVEARDDVIPADVIRHRVANIGITECWRNYSTQLTFQTQVGG